MSYSTLLVPTAPQLLCSCHLSTWRDNKGLLHEVGAPSGQRMQTSQMLTSASALALASLAAISRSSRSCRALLPATAMAPATAARCAMLSWKAFRAASRANSCFSSVL